MNHLIRPGSTSNCRSGSRIDFSVALGLSWELLANEIKPPEWREPAAAPQSFLVLRPRRITHRTSQITACTCCWSSAAPFMRERSNAAIAVWPRRRHDATCRAPTGSPTLLPRNDSRPGLLISAQRRAPRAVRNYIPEPSPAHRATSRHVRSRSWLRNMLHGPVGDDPGRRDFLFGAGP